MLRFAEAGQVRVDDGGCRAFVSEVDLDLAEVLALFEQMGGVGVAQCVDVGVFLDAAGFQSEAKGALQGGAAHRFGGRGRALSTVTFGGKDQRGMPMAFPLFAQELKGAHGQRHVTVLVALAAADVQEHALGIDVAHLQAQPFAQPQTAGVNGDQADAMIQRSDFLQHAAHFAGREDDRELELRVGAGQLDFMRPGAFEGFLPEDFDGADGLGGSLAGDFLFALEVDAILADVLRGDEVGRFAAELAQLADAGEVGLFGARADGQEF
jgi:hypothetical protein